MSVDLFPDEKTLGKSAVELIHTHFDALNRGDEPAFRRTAFLFEGNDGEPYHRWWHGMRGLAPYSLRIGEVVVSGTSVKPKPVPHLSIWVEVWAQSSKGPHEGRFVVYYLVDSAEYKLGCRLHWWLESFK